MEDHICDKPRQAVFYVKYFNRDATQIVLIKNNAAWHEDDVEA